MDVLSGHSDFVEMREPYSKDSCLTADMLGSDSYGCGDNYVFFLMAVFFFDEVVDHCGKHVFSCHSLVCVLTGCVCHETYK